MQATLSRIAAQPWADRKRVMVSFAWDGEGPADVEVSLFSDAGELLARMLVVELNERRMDVTLHAREPLLPGAGGVAQVRLLKEDAELDCRVDPFVMPVPAAEQGGASQTL